MGRLLALPTRMSLACALVLFVGSLYASSAAAYRRSVVPGTGTCLFWNERVLSWTMQADGSHALGFEKSQAALERSFDTWGSVGCSDLRFLQAPPIGEVKTGYFAGEINENTIVFRQVACEEVVDASDACIEEGECANLYGCWDFERSVIAVTTTTFREKTGEILDADIEFNDSDFDFTDVDGPPCDPGVTPPCVAVDLQNTATHEIGHFVGLDHVADPRLVMFASSGLGETTKRELTEDEVQAVCDIYPAGGPTWVCYSSSGLREVGAQDGCSCAAASSADTALWLGLLSLARWFGRRPRGHTTE